MFQILSQRVQSAKRVRKRFLDNDEDNEVGMNSLLLVYLSQS